MIGARIIEIPTWGSLSLIEAAWLAAGLLAMFFTIAHMPTLIRDVRWATEQRPHRPALRRLAKRDLRRELVRLYTGVAITAIGVYGGSQDSAVNGTTTVGLGITFVFLTIGFGTALQSWWDWHDREVAAAAIAKGHNGHH